MKSPANDITSDQTAISLDTDPDDENHVDTLKYMFETFKHLSTLSAGTLVLLTAITDRLFDEPEGMFHVGIAFAALIACSAGSLMAMFGTARLIGHPSEISQKDVAWFLLIGMAAAVGGFGFGLAAMARFVWINAA